MQRAGGIGRELPALPPLVGAVAAGACVAVGIVWQPVLAAGGLGVALLIAACGLGARSRLPAVYLYSLGGLLAGYAFLGKGFAYLGVAPVYVGEAVLGVGALAVLTAAGVRPALRSRLCWLVIAFMAWGALRTLPYVATYKVDALRDAVLWGYGGIALATVVCLAHTGGFRRMIDGYGKLVPWLLLWLPCALVIFGLAARFIPQLPVSGMPVLFMKPGDAAVHLAGCTAFFALGLHRGTGRVRTRPVEWIWWTAVLATFVLAGAQNRGGMISFLAAMAVASLGRALGRLGAPLLIGIMATSVFFLAGTEIEFGKGRRVSPQQIAENLASVVGASERKELSSTRKWRLRWWTDIADYTFFGAYFWTGKGFGVNLADDDGYQVDHDGSLRSPHNGHLNILARAGVPGFGLWLLLNGSFAIALLRAQRRARRQGQDWWARVDIWILAYWTAFFLNASFDVFLEGPQAGIWFWSLIGLGIAALQLQAGAGDPPGAGAGGGRNAPPHPRVAEFQTRS